MILFIDYILSLFCSEDVVWLFVVVLGWVMISVGLIDIVLY